MRVAMESNLDDNQFMVYITIFFSSIEELRFSRSSTMVLTRVEYAMTKESPIVMLRIS